MDSTLNPPALSSLTLNNYLPGFSSIFHFMNFDSWMSFIFPLSAIVAYLGWKPSLETLEKWGMSTISLRWTDKAFEPLERWLSRHVQSSQQIATTGARFSWIDDENPMDEEHVSTSGRLYTLPRINTAPAPGRYWFFYRNRLIILVREEDKDIWGKAHTLHLKCFGWDVSLLQDILHEARQEQSECNSKIAVYSAFTQSDGCEWTRSQSQPFRSLNSIIMEKSEKDNFVDDVNKHLQSRHKVISRGIPHRRGYLFSGPPGTGKTSLCIAIASALDLDIYTVNLNSLTDYSLHGLVSKLPERCILLLEDIDAQPATKDRSKEEKEQCLIPRQISLGFVLNAIDGVVSTQGRILIMTTNHKDKLDPALLRPGRVDLELNFKLPSAKLIEDLFLMIYSDEPSKDDMNRPWFDLPRCQRCPQIELCQPDSQTSNAQKETLQKLAVKFASCFPRDTFSQADIISYLVQYLDKPESAVEEIGEFIKTKQNGKDNEETGEDLCHPWEKCVGWLF